MGKHGFLLTGGNAWPPKEMYAALSTDGLNFDHSTLPQQPILRPSDIDPNSPSMKVLRCAWDSRRQVAHAVANVWDREKKSIACTR